MQILNTIFVYMYSPIGKKHAPRPENPFQVNGERRTGISHRTHTHWCHLMGYTQARHVSCCCLFSVHLAIHTQPEQCQSCLALCHLKLTLNYLGYTNYWSMSTTVFIYLKLPLEVNDVHSICAYHRPERQVLWKNKWERKHAD